MHDKRKIAIMANLAIYDKNFSEEDIRKDQYFRHDYIYKKNMRNRIFIFLGCMIITFFSVLYRIAYKDLDIYAINYTQELVKIVLFFAVMLIAYTVIGTIIFTAEFHKSQNRLDKYFALLERLNKYNLKKKRLAEAKISEDEDEQDEEEFDEEEPTETDGNETYGNETYGEYE